MKRIVRSVIAAQEDVDREQLRVLTGRVKCFE